MPYTRLGDIGTLDVNTGVTGGNLCCILTLNNTVQLMGRASTRPRTSQSYPRA